MALSRNEAERDGVVVPLTQEDYCIKTKIDSNPPDSVDMADFYDDDYDIDDDDDDEEDDEDCSDNNGKRCLKFQKVCD